MNIATKSGVKAALTALALTTPLLATPANAIMKDIKFHVVQGSYHQPVTMEMKHNGSKWVWANKSSNFPIQIKVKIKTVGNKFDSAGIFVHESGMYLWKMPEGYRTRNYEKLVPANVGKSVLSPLQGKARALCDVFGGSKKAVRDMNIEAVLSAYHSADIYGYTGKLPIKVVCQPKPPKRAKTDLKVSKLKLYTIPARPKCGQPVRLVTEIHTNKPGKVNFMLYRHDGAKQAASVKTGKAGKGYAKRWAKTYTFEKTTKRKYMVVLKGHKHSTKWVPLNVNCGLKGGAKSVKLKK